MRVLSWTRVTVTSRASAQRRHLSSCYGHSPAAESLRTRKASEHDIQHGNADLGALLHTKLLHLFLCVHVSNLDRRNR